MNSCTRQIGFGPAVRSRSEPRRGRGLRVLVAWLAGLFLVPTLVPAQYVQAVELKPVAAPSPPSLPADPAERLLILVANLTGDGTPTDRKQAALAILELGNSESVKALSGILGLRNNAGAKLAICDALAEVETIPEGLADALFGLLAEQRERALRDGAVAALYRCNDPAVSQRLREFLEQEELQWLRAENVARSRELYSLLPRESDRIARLQTWLRAAQPLDRLTALEIIHSAMLASTPAPPAKEVLQQIRQMLRDPDEAVRRKLVVVLRDLQEKEDAARIVDMLEHERSPVVQEEIYKALGRMGASDTISACILGLESPNTKVAAGAADALGRLCRQVNGETPPQTGDAVKALLKRTTKPIEDPVLRGQVINAMASIADPQFLPVLVAHAGVDEPVPQIRQAAFTGIGAVGDASHLDLVIVRLSEDADAGVREAAADALGKLGNKALHLRPLTSCLSDPSQAVQNKCWQAYRQVFARLSLTERMEILATWTATDKATIARRIDLLTDLESQATAAKSEAAALLRIREDLGDALLAGNEYALAAAAFTRAMDSLPAEQGGRRNVIAPKLLDAWLHAPAHDRAISLVLAATSPEMLASFAERLLAYVEDLARIDGRAAQECIERFRKGAPALFEGDWGPRFDQIRRAASQPATTASG